MRSVFLAALVSLSAIGAGTGAEPDTCRFDVLRHPQYHCEMTRLLKGKALPDWVSAFLDEGDGVASPSKTVQLAGKSYRIDRLCKVHDCAGNVLVVLWAPGGRRAWAALTEAGRAAPTLFGDPPADQAQALTASLQSN